MNKITYTTEMVCAKSISFSIEEGVLRNVVFSSGCPGGLIGISKLIEGMPVMEVVNRLKGIECGGKGTSCPDQLVRAIEKVLKDNNFIKKAV